MYERAYELGTLVDPILSILISLANIEAFAQKTVSDITTNLKEVIFEHISEPNAQDLFEYANEQMIKLKLDDDTCSGVQLIQQAEETQKKIDIVSEDSVKEESA